MEVRLRCSFLVWDWESPFNETICLEKGYVLVWIILEQKNDQIKPPTINPFLFGHFDKLRLGHWQISLLNIYQPKDINYQSTKRYQFFINQRISITTLYCHCHWALLGRFCFFAIITALKEILIRVSLDFLLLQSLNFSINFGTFHFFALFKSKFGKTPVSHLVACYESE